MSELATDVDVGVDVSADDDNDGTGSLTALRCLGGFLERLAYHTHVHMPLSIRTVTKWDFFGHSVYRG